MDDDDDKVDWASLRLCLWMALAGACLIFIINITAIAIYGSECPYHNDNVKQFLSYFNRLEPSDGYKLQFRCGDDNCLEITSEDEGAIEMLSLEKEARVLMFRMSSVWYELTHSHEVKLFEMHGDLIYSCDGVKFSVMCQGM